MLLSEHVYCVPITFKMTEWVEQWICIRFCLKLEHSSAETIQMIQKAIATGNWWLAALSQQCTHSYVMSHADFFGETSNHPGDSDPTIAQIWCPVTSSFSQNSNHLWEGRDSWPSMRFRKIQLGSWWWLGELCEIPGCLLWSPMYNFSCISYLLQ